MNSVDEKWMQRALKLAAQGKGYVSPNPLVGAVIVDENGQALAEGFHRKHGAPHAEIEALKALAESEYAAADLSQATLYCNLEPCSHSGAGKINPPCAPALLEAGFKRVVIAMLDPNPKVSGRGVALLREAGIEVEVGICEAEARRLNRIFCTHILKQRPYVLVKAAQTLDGRIATRTGHSRWISNHNARARSHVLRAEYDAVLVGSGTVWHDDPKLNVRHVEGPDPYRLVLDSRLNLSLDYQIFSDELKEKTIVFTSLHHDPSRFAHFTEQGIKVLQVEIDNGRLDLKAVLKAAYAEGITSILVEGGERLLTRLLECKYADAMWVVIAPKIIGRGVDTVGDLSLDRMDEAIQFEDVHYEILDDQVIFEGTFARCLLDS